jgi:ATP-binding cassette subfamily B protein
LKVAGQLLLPATLAFAAAAVLAALIRVTNLRLNGRMAAAVVAAGLLAGLLLIDWGVALGAAVLFGSVYGLFALTANRELHRNSKRIATAARQQIKALQEGLRALRDVLLHGNQRAYLKV